MNYPRMQREADLAADGSKPSEVELLNTEVLADRHFRYELLTLRTETFAGKLSPPFKREALRSGTAVAVLLYDPAAHQLIMIEQFRIAATEQCGEVADRPLGAARFNGIQPL